MITSRPLMREGGPGPAGWLTYNMSRQLQELLALFVSVPRRSLGPSVLA